VTLKMVKYARVAEQIRCKCATAVRMCFVCRHLLYNLLKKTITSLLFVSCFLLLLLHLQNSMAGRGVCKHAQSWRSKKSHVSTVGTSLKPIFDISSRSNNRDN
jgi:hypothetical protein